MALGWVALVGVMMMVQPAAAAEVKNFAVKGSGAGMSYEGTVRVTPLETTETKTMYWKVDWTFGAYAVHGLGVVAKDDDSILTVSYVVPAGLGVARYRLSGDGDAKGVLVGAKGIFVEEVWTSLDRNAAPAAAPAPAAPPAPAAVPAPGKSKTGR